MHRLKRPVLVADDHDIVRHGMKLLVKEIFPHAVIIEATSYKEIITKVKQQELGLLILDNSISGSTGIKMLDAIRAIQPDIKVLVFSANDERIYAIRYVKAGAKGYLSKQSVLSGIRSAINVVMDGETYVSQAVKDMLLDNVISNKAPGINPLKKLSQREFEVAKLLISGMSVSEIANTLNLELSTISTYKNRIRTKLNVPNIINLLEVFHLYESSLNL